MALLKKPASLSENEFRIPAAATATAECGFALIEGEKEQVSPNLSALLGIELSRHGLRQVLKENDAACFAPLKSLLLAAEKNGKVLFSSADGTRQLQAVSTALEGNAKACMVWIYDITEIQQRTKRLEQENETLKNDAKQSANLLNMSPYPIWLRDSDLNIRYYNLKYAEMVDEGSDREPDAKAPELDRSAKALAKITLEGAQPQNERRYIVAGGERRLFQFYDFPLPEEKQVVSFAHDISEIERLEQELDRYMSAQADLLESSASAMAIYGSDMRMQHFNDAFVKLWSLEEHWLETKPSYSEVLEALREKRKLPEQANFQHFKQQQLKVFTDLIASREEFFYLPDGRTLKVIVIPHALGGVLFAYEDVTDRLALERSYNTLIAVQRETLDNLQEGIAVFGEDGRLRLSNPIFLSLWDIDAATAREEPHISDLIERMKPLYRYSDWDEFREQQVTQIHARSSIRSRVERADGKVIGSMTVPLPDGATLISYLDITDSTLVERSLRERNDALTEADRLKSQFLANVSYELRSPLTSISGFADMLRQEYFGKLNEKQTEYVEGIHASSQQLMRLVNDILDLASIEAGYMELNLQDCEVRELLDTVVGLTHERAREHRIRVKVSCEDGIGMLNADETRLKQILFNLLSNAIRYTPAGGEVSVSAKAADKMIVFAVSDTGSGIREKDKPFVFESFYKGSQADLPKSKQRSGTGLGLSLVKSFVELHGGKVELSSEEGKGTVVKCLLPRG